MIKLDDMIGKALQDLSIYNKNRSLLKKTPVKDRTSENKRPLRRLPK